MAKVPEVLAMVPLSPAFSSTEQTTVPSGTFPRGSTLPMVRSAARRQQRHGSSRHCSSGKHCSSSKLAAAAAPSPQGETQSSSGARYSQQNTTQTAQQAGPTGPTAAAAAASTFLAAVDKLASVQPLHSQHPLLVDSVAISITEGNNSKRGAAARVVFNGSHQPCAAHQAATQEASPLISRK